MRNKFKKLELETRILGSQLGGAKKNVDDVNDVLSSIQEWAAKTDGALEGLESSVAHLRGILKEKQGAEASYVFQFPNPLTLSDVPSRLSSPYDQCSLSPSALHSPMLPTASESDDDMESSLADALTGMSWEECSKSSSSKPGNPVVREHVPVTLVHVS